MNYKNVWLGACFGTLAGGLINVKFKGDPEPQPFTMDCFGLLKTEPRVEWIESEETGEILYCCD